MRTLLACLFLLAPPAAEAQHFGEIDRQIGVRSVSLVSLIATPERFHGKKVRVIGAINIEFEGNMLCLHAEDLRKAISANCVWLDPNYEVLRATPPTLASLNGRYALVEGTYNMHHTGHMGCCAGALDSVTRIDAWGNGK